MSEQTTKVDPKKVSAPVSGEMVDKKPKPKTRAEQFQDALDKQFGTIAAALPRHIDPKRFMRVALVAASKPSKSGQDSVLDCTMTSIMLCLITCAQLGFEPDSPQQFAHLIPRRLNGQEKQPTCTLQIGYRGMIHLARNTGEIKQVAARVVYANDEFDYEYGLDERLVHRPTDEEDTGPVVAAYAVWQFKDGGHHFDVMRRKALERIKARSKKGSSSPWDTDEEEMFKKTVLKRSAKMVPMSPQQRLAEAADNAADDGQAPQPMEFHFDGDSRQPPLLEEKPETMDFGDAEKKPDLDTVVARRAAERQERQQQQAETTAEAGAAAKDQPAQEERTTAAAVTFAKPAALTPTQRTEIGRLAAAKGVDLGEVAEWFEAESTRALTQTQAAAAIIRLAALPDALADEPGSGG